MVVIQTLMFTYLTLLCHICWRVCLPTVTYDWFPVICVNRDGCHMWGRKCSLFPEHLIPLPLGIWLYIHYIIGQSKDCSLINYSGLFTRTVLSWTYFIGTCFVVFFSLVESNFFICDWSVFTPVFQNNSWLFWLFSSSDHTCMWLWGLRRPHIHKAALRNKPSTFNVQMLINDLWYPFFIPRPV